MTTDRGDGPVDFIRDVLAHAGTISLRPALWIPAATISLAADAVVALVNYPFRDGLPPPPEHAITTMVIVILAKGWFSLTLARIALAILRRQHAGFLNQWVPVTAALRIAFVSLVLLAPILLGLLFLVVPGVYLLARWSQATLALIDDRATWFDAADMSNSLTAGYRPWIILIFAIVAAVAVPIDNVVERLTPLAWLWRAVGSTFGAALAASMYYELSWRAPWRPEG